MLTASYILSSLQVIIWAEFLPQEKIGKGIEAAIKEGLLNAKNSDASACKRAVARV